MNETVRLAELSTKIHYRDIPEEVIFKAKECILDTLGCILGGSKEAEVHILLRYIDETAGKPEATILGFGKRTNAPDASLVNGTMAHVLDFDDTQHSLMGHPSAVILPATLAMGEKIESTGQAILESFIVGYEVACKIGKGVNPQLYKNGWHATSVIGSFGAAVASGKLLRLNVSEMTSLLGLTASLTSGLRENFGTMTKPFHAGRAAQNGVISAMLAKDGFTSSCQILEAKRGFCSTFSGQYDINRILENFGNPFEMVSPGVHLKPYPSCLETHSIIEATLFLVETYKIRFEEVESVECGIPPLAFDILIHSNPKTGLEGKFSAQYAVAISLIHRKATLEQFKDQEVQNPKVKEMIKKVRVLVRPELEGTPQSSIVKIRLKDGKEFSKRIDITLGHPERPLSIDQIIEKYRSCVDSMIEKEDRERSIDMVLNIERLSNLKELIQLLVRRS